MAEPMTIELLDGQVIVTATGEVHGNDHVDTKELARRVSACINACQGISTTELEQGIVEQMRSALTKVIPMLEQRVHHDAA
jgi:hypothetical protein